MPCKHCHIGYPGEIIEVTKERKCIYCNELVNAGLAQLHFSPSKEKWDKYFLTVCVAVASKSPCISRQIGSIIVRDRSIVSTGYNGPPRGYPHCEGSKCPRHVKGYKSGEGLGECPATHSEANAIANAAKLGVSVEGCTLYLNTDFPCKDCMSLLVNAGIKKVVSLTGKYYHTISDKVAKHGNISLRRFST